MPSIWRLSVELTSEPSVLFWKKGKEQKLNDVPQKKFTYTQQFMFHQFEPGASYTIPIEVHAIKEDSYVWTLKIKSKDGVLEKKINVNFKAE